MIRMMMMMMSPPCTDVDNADGGKDVILFSRKETARLILLWGTICLESHPSLSAVNDFVFSTETCQSRKSLIFDPVIQHLKCLHVYTICSARTSTIFYNSENWLWEWFLWNPFMVLEGFVFIFPILEFHLQRCFYVKTFCVENYVFYK